MVGLIFLVSAPLIPLFMALAGWGAEAASQQQASAVSRLSGRFADRLRGLTALKLLGRQAAEIEGVRSASEALRQRTMVVMRIAFLSSAVLEFFAALGVAGVALYIGLTFLDLVSLRGSELSLAAGMFCLLLAPEVYQPLRLLAANYHDRASAKAGAAEMLAQLEALPVPVNITPAPPPVATSSTGPVALKLAGVSIATPTGRQVIDHLNLALAPGARIAILGQSGIGKSTLIEAVARLHEFAGEITLDGADLRDLAEPTLRDRVALLSQRPRIFAGSIAGNIRLGRARACDTTVLLAAQRACVTDFADALPKRLGTMIGENGLGLSGGEVQRIALARLYLRNPGLLLLVEPTAHLDAMTESRVLDGLLDFARGRTLLVTTHSASVAARMNRVYRLAGGGLLPALRPIIHDQRRSVA
jgi:ATP-binding cassette subfamily C protein CydD